MKKLFLILIVFFTVTVFSQDTSHTSKPKWSIGFSGGLNSYENIKAYNGFNHKYTYNKIGFRGGIESSYHFSKRSTVTSGFLYFNLDYNADYVWIFQQPNDPAIPRNSNASVSYLDIPVIYNFNIISKDKIVFYTATGIIPSVLISNKGNTTYEDNSIRKFDYANSFMLSLQLGAGLQYNLNKKLGIKIESHYRQFLKGFDSIMDQSPSATCVTLGIVSKIDWKCFFKKGAWKPLPSCD